MDDHIMYSRTINSQKTHKNLSNIIIGKDFKLKKGGMQSHTIEKKVAITYGHAALNSIVHSWRWS